MKTGTPNLENNLALSYNAKLQVISVNLLLLYLGYIPAHVLQKTKHECSIMKWNRAKQKNCIQSKHALIGSSENERAKCTRMNVVESQKHIDWKKQVTQDIYNNNIHRVIKHVKLNITTYDLGSVQRACVRKPRNVVMPFHCINNRPAISDIIAATLNTLLLKKPALLFKS